MRRQLSQPSLINGFARSREESVRPDLWPAYAYIPSLGFQGETLLGLSYGHNAPVINGAWSDNALVFNGTTTYVPLTAIQSTGQHTVVVDLTTIYALNSARIFGFSAADTTPCDLLYYNSRFDFFGGGFEIHPANVVGVRAMVACVFDSGNFARLYRDGFLNGEDTSISTYTPVTFEIGRRTDATRYGNFSLHSLLYYNRILSQREILELYRDVTLPLRRKTMISLYIQGVVSGFYNPFVSKYMRSGTLESKFVR